MTHRHRARPHRGRGTCTIEKERGKKNPRTAKPTVGVRSAGPSVVPIGGARDRVHRDEKVAPRRPWTSFIIHHHRSSSVIGRRDGARTRTRTRGERAPDMGARRRRCGVVHVHV